MHPIDEALTIAALSLTLTALTIAANYFCS